MLPLLPKKGRRLAGSIFACLLMIALWLAPSVSISVRPLGAVSATHQTQISRNAVVSHQVSRVIAATSPRLPIATPASETVTAAPPDVDRGDFASLGPTVHGARPPPRLCGFSLDIRLVQDVAEAQTFTPTYDSWHGGNGSANNDFDGTHSLSAIGFTDVNSSGSFTFLSNTLQMATTGGSDFNSKFLIRPQSEDGTTGCLGVSFQTFTGGGESTILVCRHQRTGNSRYLALIGSNLSVTFYASVNGGLSQLTTTSTTSPGAVTGSFVRAYLSDSPNATAGTDLICTIVDDASGQVISQNIVLGDTTAALQSAGGRGITGQGGTFEISRIRTSASKSIDNKIGVICAGNSLMYGYNTQTTQNTLPIPLQLQGLLPSNYTVLNSGQYGFTTEHIWGYVIAPDRAIPSPYIDRQTSQTSVPFVTSGLLNPEFKYCVLVYLEIVNSLGGENVGNGQTVNDVYLRLVQATIDAKSYGFRYVIMMDDPANNENTEDSRIAVNALIAGDTTNFDGKVYTSLLTVGGVQICNSEAATENSTYYQADKIHFTNAADTPAAAAIAPVVLNLTATPAVSAVSVSPSTATVSGAATQQFAATVTAVGGAATTATWSATAGSISTGGLFTAPSATSSVQTITITATSTFDNTKSATATVTVPIAAPTVSAVSVSPSTATVAGAATQQFSATVTGTNSPGQTVTWSATAGSVNSSGLFTAPAATGSTQTITVTATSTVDNTKSGAATVTVPAMATVATPTFSPVSGSYSGTQTVTISSATSGASLFYTVDGSTPTTSSSVYSAALSVASSETVKALAVKAGMTNSAIGQAAYVISSGSGSSGLQVSDLIDSAYNSGVSALQLVEELYVVDQCNYHLSPINTVSHTRTFTFYAANGSTVLATATQTYDSTNTRKLGRPRFSFSWNNFAVASGNMLLTTVIDSTGSSPVTVGNVFRREDAIRIGVGAETVAGAVDTTVFYGQGGSGAGAYFTSVLTANTDGSADRVVTTVGAN